MLKKIKRAVENWLRNILDATIAKLNVSLREEREEFQYLLAKLETRTEAFDKAVDRFLDGNDAYKEVLKLRAHCKEMDAHIAEVNSIVAKLQTPKTI